MRILLALAGLAGLAGALMVPTLAAEPIPDARNALTVVRSGVGDLAGVKASFTRAWQGCAEQLKLGVPMPPLPSDRVLAGLALYEAEELFDGPRWALFESFGTPAADPQRRCGWVVYWQRNAVVETACQRHESGRSASAGMAQELGWAPAEPATHSDEPLSAADCQDPTRAPALDGLPREPAGDGRYCVWARQILASRLAKLPHRPGAGAGAGAHVGGHRAGGETDVCLYDQQPYYAAQGKVRRVILMTKADLRSADGSHAVPRSVGETQAMSTALKRLSTAPIDKNRFSRAAIDQFIARPAKTPVEEPK